MRVEFSRRYLVIGLYFDRERPTLRLYPFPGVRVSIYLTRVCRHGWKITDDKRSLTRCTDPECNP